MKSQDQIHYGHGLHLREVSSNAVLERMHRYVNLAKALFRKGACSNGRTFNVCFAVKKSKVIAIGLNDYDRQMIGYSKRLKTDYKFYGESSYIPSCHAEVSAILKLGLDDCSEYSFYNVRLTKACHCSFSQPCSNCLRLLRMVRAKHIYCYDNDMKICEVVSKPS